jgi:hypothetical protein
MCGGEGRKKIQAPRKGYIGYWDYGVPENGEKGQGQKKSLLSNFGDEMGTGADI